MAEALRAEERAALSRLSPAERVRLALALGQRDLDAFRLARDPALSPAQAARELERRRQASRRPCRCIEELLA